MPLRSAAAPVLAPSLGHGAYRVRLTPRAGQLRAPQRFSLSLASHARVWLAEASIAVTNLFEEAQKAADIYLHNIYALGNEYRDALRSRETTDEPDREE